MTISTRHAYTATGTNNSAKQVSVDRWNAALTTTGTATGTFVFDEGGSPVELLGDLTLEMFGGDGTGDTANDTALAELLAYIAAEDRNRGGWVYRGARRILLPGREYGFDAGIELKSTVHMLGFSSGMAGGISTKLVFPASSHGIRVNRHDTLGSGGAVASTTGADGSILEGLYIEGGAGSQNIQKAGIHMRARAVVRDCVVTNFAGPGILIYAETGSGDFTYGNANNWRVENVRLGANKYSGLYVRGGDANAGLGMMIDATTNARYGIEDRSFLGNTYIACHADANGTGTSGGVASTSVVSDGTWRYQLVDGQDANALSTPPTTGESNSVWRLQGAGAAAAHAGIYTYDDEAGDYASGGGYYIGGTNARSVLLGCYSEGGQADPIILVPSMSVGGFMTQNQGAVLGDGGQMVASTKGLTNHNGFAKVSNNPGTDVIMTAGVGSDDEETVLRGSHSDNHPLEWSFGFGVGGFQPENFWLDYGGTAVWRITGANTTEQFGTGANKPYVFQCNAGFALDDAGGTFRIIKRCAAQADTTAADLAALKTDFNALLAKLRAANLLAT